MTDCREFRDLLQEELDGRLAAPDAARLAEHVASCAACAEERRGLASLRATFRAMPRPAAPARLRGDVMSSLPKGRVRNLHMIVGWIAAAAALFVVAVTLMPNSREVGRDVAVLREEAAPRAAAVPDSAKVSADDVAVAPTKAAGARDAEKDSAPAAAAPAAPALAARKKAESAASPATRYVVFRDAAAADSFAKRLASLDSPSAKDKGVAPGFAFGGAAGAPPGAERRSDADVELLKAAESARGRVVARASVAGPIADAEFSARVADAGGTLVPLADTSRFASVVDPPLVGAGEGTDRNTKTDDRAGKPAAEPQAGTFGPAGRAAPPRVTVVIVVLEAPR